METFTVRDLRERTGDLIRGAEEGRLSVITKHGAPVFVAVPFDEILVREGITVALAVHLFDEEQISLGKASATGWHGPRRFHQASGPVEHPCHQDGRGGIGAGPCFV